MSDLKEPKHFKIFRIVGFLSLFVGVVLIILGIAVFRVKVYDGSTMLNAILFIPGMLFTALSLPCLFIGYAPKINKMQIEHAKYVNEINKENIKDIASTSADIVSEPISKVAKSVKDSISETKFCKHCGAKIDADSRFCKKCGKEQ